MIKSSFNPWGGVDSSTLEDLINPQFMLEAREEKEIQEKKNKKSPVNEQSDSDEISVLFEPKFHQSSRFKKPTLSSLKKKNF